LRKRHTEWTEKKMEEKGSEVGGWRLLKALGAQGGEGKKGGGVCSVRGWVGDVGRHGMDAVALGCSDSGGWCMPHGRGGRGLRTGEDSGAHDVERRD
jgi:hypothetical protein